MPIRVLWPHEVVRKRPGMFVGPDATPGGRASSLLDMVTERLSDPRFANDATRVDVRIWPGPIFEFIDDGRGWPTDVERAGDTTLGHLDRVMTELTTGTPTTDDYRRFGPFFGFGLVVNALTSRLSVETNSSGVRYQARYSRGGIITPVRASRVGAGRGTRIVLELDEFVFDVDAQAQAALQTESRSATRSEVLVTRSTEGQPYDPF